MLVLVYRQVEIAECLGLTKGVVSQRLGTTSKVFYPIVQDF
jgi:hypothetical protein